MMEEDKQARNSSVQHFPRMANETVFEKRISSSGSPKPTWILEF
jgi:hypothetical protein